MVKRLTQHQDAVNIDIIPRRKVRINASTGQNLSLLHRDRGLGSFECGLLHVGARYIPKHVVVDGVEPQPVVVLA